jgi:hypothetical protein
MDQFSLYKKLQFCCTLTLACFEQANRALRQASLGTLNSLLTAYSNKISPASYDSIVTELSSLIRWVMYLSSVIRR